MKVLVWKVMLSKLAASHEFTTISHHTNKIYYYVKVFLLVCSVSTHQKLDEFQRLFYPGINRLLFISVEGFFPQIGQKANNNDLLTSQSNGEILVASQSDCPEQRQANGRSVLVRTHQAHTLLQGRDAELGLLLRQQLYEQSVTVCRLTCVSKFKQFCLFFLIWHLCI